MQIKTRNHTSEECNKQAPCHRGMHESNEILWVSILLRLNLLHACRPAQGYTPTEVELNDPSSFKEGEEDNKDDAEYPIVSITEDNKESAEYPIVSITEDGMQMTVRK